MNFPPSLEKKQMLSIDLPHTISFLEQAAREGYADHKTFEIKAYGGMGKTCNVPIITRNNLDINHNYYKKFIKTSNPSVPLSYLFLSGTICLKDVDNDYISGLIKAELVKTDNKEDKWDLFKIINNQAKDYSDLVKFVESNKVIIESIAKDYATEPHLNASQDFIDLLRDTDDFTHVVESRYDAVEDIRRRWLSPSWASSKPRFSEQEGKRIRRLSEIAYIIPAASNDLYRFLGESKSSFNIWKLQRFLPKPTKDFQYALEDKKINEATNALIFAYLRELYIPAPKSIEDVLRLRDKFHVRSASAQFMSTLREWSHLVVTGDLAAEKKIRIEIKKANKSLAKVAGLNKICDILTLAQIPTMALDIITTLPLFSPLNTAGSLFLFAYTKQIGKNSSWHILS